MDQEPIQTDTSLEHDVEFDDLSPVEQDFDVQFSNGEPSAQRQKRKGGRKPIYATVEERKQRNRQAQAAFRERRSGYIKQLEATLKQHEETLQSMQANHRAVSDDFVTLKQKCTLLERMLLEKGVNVEAELQLRNRKANAKQRTSGSYGLSDQAAQSRPLQQQQDQGQRHPAPLPSPTSQQQQPSHDIKQHPAGSSHLDVRTDLRNLSPRSDVQYHHAMPLQWQQRPSVSPDPMSSIPDFYRSMTPPQMAGNSHAGHDMTAFPHSSMGLSQHLETGAEASYEHSSKNPDIHGTWSHRPQHFVMEQSHLGAGMSGFG